MNALCYKIVFSKRLGTLVAVGEHTVGQGKTASGSGVRNVVNGAVSSFIGALSAVFAAVALTYLTASFTASVGFAAGPAANALPSGASVNSGSVAISSTSSSNAATMNITQSTDKASVNWQSFNIGSAARVNVQQNSASSVLLNRVVGNDPSQIFGKLSANGQVILINPNGIVFGSGGSVTASAFTASTFGLSEQDFANNKYKFTRSGSAAGVTVQDGATLNATAPGGYIALIGASVDNQGRISTQQGAVVLAAGESVALPASLTNNISVPLSGKVRLELLPSTINAMVANSGTITTEGGQVLMQAAALSDAVASITHTGTIDTTGTQGGAVTVLADGGVIKATGSITANSLGNDEHGQLRKGGDIIIGRDEETDVLAHATDVSGAKLESQKGFVETSGDYLKVDGIQVKAKDWLLDPTDITINATDSNVTNTVGTLAPTVPGTATSINASTIVTALGTTNVIVQTGNSGAGTGNITVNAAINAAVGNTNSLTLKAYKSINITSGNGIDLKGGDLILLANAYSGANTGNVTVSAALNGKNISIDNTGGTIIATSGAIAKGASAGATGAAGIKVDANITASGNLNMYGLASNNNNGIYLNTATLSGGNIQAVGNSGTGNPSGFISNAGNITTTGTSGASSVTGISETTTSGGGAAAMQLVGGTYTAATGTTLTVEGQATGIAASNFANTRGLRVEALVNTSGTVTLKGSSSNNDGLLVQTGGINVQVGALTLDGKNTSNGTSSGQTGVNVSQAIKLSNGTSLNIIGKTANQAGSATSKAETGVSINSTISQVSGQTTAGNVTITGSSSSYSNSNGVVINSNISTGTGNIKIIGQRLAGGTGNAVNLNGNLSTAGNVTVQSPGGNINQASGKTISGANITVDNTGIGLTSLIADSTGNPTLPALAVGTSMGGTIDTSTGAITAGSGTSLNSIIGVNMSGTLNSIGDITLVGNSDSNTGVKFSNTLTSTNGKVLINGTSKIFRGVENSGATVTALGAIEVTGTSLLGNGFAHGIIGNANMTGGSIKMTGTALGGRGIFQVGQLTANTGDVTLVGISTNEIGVNVDKAVTANNGNIKITGTSANSQAVAISSAVTANGGGNINITGNTDTNNGSGTAVSINGSGTVIANGATGVPAGKITIIGNANTGMGIFNSAVIKGGAVDMKGTGKGAGKAVYSFGAITSTVGGVSIKGTNTGSSGSIGTHIQGPVTAQTDINLEGYTAGPSQGLLIQSTAVTSTVGNITVKGENKWNDGRAVSIFDGLLKNVAGGKTININANTLFITGTTPSSTSVDAGSTGTVNIKTLTPGNEIKIGSSDVGSATLGSQILGIDNGELNRITAGKTVIGDTASTGKISITGATTTLAQTGNIVLQTGGNIDVNAALTIAPDKTLTLNGAGTSSTISQTNTNAGITADKVEFLGSNATVTLQPTGIPVSSANKIGVIAGNVKSFALTNQRDLKVSVVNGTTGLTAVNDIKLTTTTATGTALSIENKIESTAGDVIINATTSDTSAATPPLAAVKSSAQVKGKDITMNAVALGASGKTLGYYGAGANGVFTALNNLTLIGSTKNQGSGFYMFEGTLSARNVLSIEGTSALGQGVGFDKTSTSPNVSITSGNGITITGTASNSTSSVHQGAINLKDVNLTNTAGAVTLTAINGDIDTSGTGTLIQNGNDGVKLTTLGHGNITVPKIINNGTGNVVIAAGSDLLAGDGTGGQVKTVAANTITQGNTTPGKTYIYSGNATDTDLLSRLDSTLGNLQVDGTATQNVDTNAAFGAGTGISGSTAKAQVIFREKVTITNGLVGTTLAKTYGDAETKNTATAALLTETKAKLKQEGGNLGTLSGTSANYTTPTPTSGNVIKIAKTAIIDSLTGNLDGAAYSGAQYLRANGTYKYNTTANPLTSSKYDIVNTTFTGDVNVTVAQKALTGTIASGNSTYGDSLNLATAGATTLTGKLTGDNVTAGISTVVLNATNTSTSGNLIAGTHTQTLTGVSGTDEANYSHAGVTGSYTVNKLALAGSIAQGNSTYGNPLAAGTANFSNVKGSGASTDVVTATGVTIDTIGNTSTSGNLKAGTHNGIQSVAGITGKDADNYTFAAVKGGYKVDQRPLSALYAANDKVYDGNNSATVVGSLQNTITGDLVNPTHTGATFDTFAVGTNKTVTVTGISLSGVDLANYKIDPVANPTFTATARAAITPSAPPPPAPVVPTNATSGRVKIPLSAANPFQLASAEELGGEDFCENTSIDPLNGDSTGNSNSSCTCEESKLAQDAQICFEKNTQKISAQ